MKSLAATLLILLAAQPALAIECPIQHAIYDQPGRHVTLAFSGLPEDAAANQIAAFTIGIHDVTSKFEGAIYLPNGFGQPLGVVGQDCTGAEGEDCGFWSGNVYALGPDGIADYPYDADTPLEAQMAPQQILLPEFASNVWYSSMRQVAFDGARNVLDAFTLATCAK